MICVALSLQWIVFNSIQTNINHVLSCSLQQVGVVLNAQGIFTLRSSDG